MKPRPRILAVLILAAAAVVLFPGCAGKGLPRWQAGVSGTYHGATYSATYDGKTISTELNLGDSLFGWAK